MKAQEGTRGSKGRGVSRRPGVLWAAVISLMLPGPARGWFTPLSKARKGRAGWGNTAQGWNLNSGLWLLPSATASWVKTGRCWARSGELAEGVGTVNVSESQAAGRAS